jgi:hypothetical protein
MNPLQKSFNKSPLGPSHGGSHSRNLKKESTTDHRWPMGAKESPRAAQGISKKAKGNTKEAQKKPTVSQRVPKKPRGTPEEVQGTSVYTKIAGQAHWHLNVRRTVDRSKKLNVCEDFIGFTGMLHMGR